MAAFERRIRRKNFSDPFRGEIYASYIKDFGLDVLCKDADCLDAGCGEGYFSELLLPFSPRSMSLFDINTKRIDIAKARFEGVANATVKFGDIYDPPFDGPFDLVICYSVLLSLNTRPALEVLSRLTKSGGHIFVQHHLPGYWLERAWDRRLRPSELFTNLRTMQGLFRRGRGVTTEGRFVRALERHFKILKIELARKGLMNNQIIALCQKP